MTSSSPRRPVARLASLVVVAGVLAVGCGAGGDDPSSAGGEPIEPAPVDAPDAEVSDTATGSDADSDTATDTGAGAMAARDVVLRERIGEGRALGATSLAGVTAIATSTGFVVRDATGASVTLPVETGVEPREIHLLADGTRLAVVGGDGWFELWDVGGPPALLRTIAGVSSALESGDTIVVVGPATIERISSADGVTTGLVAAPPGSTVGAVGAGRSGVAYTLDGDGQRLMWWPVGGEPSEAGLGADLVVGRIRAVPGSDRFVLAAAPPDDPFAGVLAGWDPAVPRLAWTHGADDAVVQATWDVDGAGATTLVSGSAVRWLGPDGSELGAAELPGTTARAVIGSPTGPGAHVLTGRGTLVRVATDDGSVEESDTVAGAVGLGVSAESVTLVATSGDIGVVGHDGVATATIDDYAAGSVTDVATAADGRLAASSTAGHVTVVDPRADAAPARLVHDEGAVGSVVFGASPSELVSGVEQRRAAEAFDDTLSIWDLEAATRVHEVPGEAEGVPNCSFFDSILRLSGDGDVLAATSHDFTVSLYSAADLTLLHTFPAHGNSILDVAFTPDDERLVTVADDLTMRVWDVEDFELLADHVTPGIRAIAPLPGGGSVLASDLTGAVFEVDLATGEQLRSFEGAKVRDAPIAVSADGRLAAAPVEGDRVRVWDVSSGRVVADAAGHTAPVTSVVFGPDPGELVSGSADGTVIVWSVVA